MQKWEYKVVWGWPSEADLNKLGKEGWELVSIVTVESENKQGAYLKRPTSN